MTVILAELIAKAHANSAAHGFWSHDAGCEAVFPRQTCHCKNLDLAMKRSLIHSEISEALEELRLTDEKRGGPLKAVLYSCVVAAKKGHHEGVGIGYMAASRFHSDGITEPACCGQPAKPEGFTVELADAGIRLFDLCGWLGRTLHSVSLGLLGSQLDNFTWGQIIEALHDGVTGLQLDGPDGTHVELLAMLEYAAIRAGGDFWAAVELKMKYNAGREVMHGKVC